MNPPTLEGSDRGYGTVARLFHWATVVSVAVLVPVGVAMTSQAFQRWADPLFILHKGLGSVVLALVLARLLWRWTFGGAAGVLPPGSPESQRRVARGVHRTLYLFLFLQAGSGYLRTRAGGYPIELLDAVGIPPLLPPMPGLEPIFVVVHRGTAFLLVALIAAHVAAVLQHALTEDDGVLGRMWPPIRRGG